jgi:pyruvate/2-oxoglutarate dehydrogenase complex dihydrolipoamide acyltransferase (E2) component
MMNSDRFTVVDFPASRLGTIDLGRIGRTKHHIAALLEIDVTEARRRLRLLRKDSGDPLSFTAWLIRTIGAAIAAHKEVHALLHAGGRKLIVYDDIDVATVVEKKVEGRLVPLPVVIAAAHRKPISEIDREIAAAKARPVVDEADHVLTKSLSTAQMKLYYLLPSFLRVAVLRGILSRPSLRKRLMGTVMLSSVGTVRAVPGWFIHKSYHNLSFGVGSVIKKPWIVDGRIAPREVLNLTILLDHDVVDGAPMARFVAHLVHLLETGDGLPAPTPTGSPVAGGAKPVEGGS